MIRDEYCRSAHVHRVLDGDTLDIDIDLGWGLTFRERVRLANVDAPEVRGPEKANGNAVAELVRRWVERAGGKVTIRSVAYKRGKYGRTIAEVFDADGTCLNNLVAIWTTDLERESK